MTRLPPPWLRDRTAEERARERKHLADLKWYERLMVAAGFTIRPKVPKENT
jgi:hypothetical protein